MDYCKERKRERERALNVCCMVKLKNKENYFLFEFHSASTWDMVVATSFAHFAI
jgi:hypothetical protein